MKAVSGLIVLSVALAASINVSAKSYHQDWLVNDNAVAVSRGTSLAYIAATESNIWISSFDKCADKTKSVIDVNGTMVKFTNFSTQRGCATEPTTIDGLNFVMNQFKTKDYVSVKGVRYSAMGFNSAIAMVEYLKNKAI